jgi:catechol 2,3-dioxygenase-like lactoylglutathione lyase family enzyme
VSCSPAIARARRTKPLADRREDLVIKGFNHIGISVRDLDRSIAFYRDLLGLDLLVQPFPFAGPMFSQVMGVDGAEGRMCVMRKESLQLELFEFARPGPATKNHNYSVADHGLTHFGIDVEDIDATYDRLAAAGVRFHCPVQTFPGGMRATYGRDMDGNVFELLEMRRAADA